MLLQEITLCRKRRYLRGTAQGRDGGGGAFPPCCQKPACHQMCLVLAVVGARHSPGSAEERRSRGAWGDVLGGLPGTPSLTRASCPGLHASPAVSASFRRSLSFLNEIWKHRHDILHLLRDGPSPRARGWTLVLGPWGAVVLELEGPGAGGCLLQGAEPEEYLLHVTCWHWCLLCGASLKPFL